MTTWAWLRKRNGNAWMLRNGSFPFTTEAKEERVKQQHHSEMPHRPPELDHPARGHARRPNRFVVAAAAESICRGRRAVGLCCFALVCRARPCGRGTKICPDLAAKNRESAGVTLDHARSLRDQTQRKDVARLKLSEGRRAKRLGDQDAGAFIGVTGLFPFFQEPMCHCILSMQTCEVGITHRRNTPRDRSGEATKTVQGRALRRGI